MATTHGPNCSVNPTDSVELDFAAYSRRKRMAAARHSIDGRPDYAFRGDYRLSTTLSSFRPLRIIADALTASWAAEHRHRAQLHLAQVGPRQFPKLFVLMRECAERLDLPVPSLFVDPAPTVNAYTIATDDRAPLVVVSAGCGDIMTEDELRFVLGHECGHIQNLHGINNLMAVIAGNAALLQASSWFSVTARLLALARHGMRLGLAAWSRAAEITCDRAGALCVEDPRSASTALARLAAPLSTDKFGAIDPDDLARRARAASQPLLHVEESGHSHPLVGKRILAVRLFLESDVFATRRPSICSSRRIPLARVDAETEGLLGSVLKA